MTVVYVALTVLYVARERYHEGCFSERGHFPVVEVDYVLVRFI